MPFIMYLLMGCGPEEEKSTVENTEEPTAVEDSASEELPTETTRYVLHEMFTGSTCGPCFDAENILMAVQEANPDNHVHLAYHVGSDPYITTEGVNRKMWYLPPEEGSYSIPYLHVDGVNGLHPVEHNSDVGYTDSDFDGFAAIPSHLELTVSHFVSEQTVDISISMMPLQDHSSEKLNLMVAIIENTTFNNVGTNGLTEFHHVMKKMVPDDIGTPLEPLTRGEGIDMELSYTFQGDYNDSTSISAPVNHDIEHTVEEFDDLSVVVFVQDTESWEVLQSAWSGRH